MPLDINLLRAEKGGDPEAVRASEKKRGRDGATIDKVVAADAEWRKSIFEMEQLKKELNGISKQINDRKKADKSDKCEDLIKKTSEVKKKMPEAENETKERESIRDQFLNSLGNIVDPSVVVNNDEAHNPVIRTWGPTQKQATFDGSSGKLHHHQILSKLMGYESKRAVEMAGHRAYFLRGVGVMLNQALISYGMSFLRRRGYTPLQTPLFMRKEVMELTAELKDFEETLYRIPVKEGRDDRDDLFLIATSEQPISAFHRGETIEEKDLPFRYAGISTCFRKEAGSHGKDMWGLFRVHQFEKVEQFMYTLPEESPAAHESMISTAEEFYQSLGLSYRIVGIVSGALNDAAAKKYDLEAWFPGHSEYKELVSVSNCTDYQARALGIKLGQGQPTKFVHLLNGTLVATERCMCCILENYQTTEGVRVPAPLVPYMDGMEFLPYPDVCLTS